MKVSINERIINKDDNKANQSKGFNPADLTPQQFADSISKGYAFSYQFKNAYRKADNFICSDIIAADFDAGMTLDEALNNEFFINNASILYTTASHTPEKHKFRIIFELPRTITDKEEIRAAQQGLTRKFPADRAAVDPARQFYGSKGCKPHHFGKVLSESNLDLLIALGRVPLNQFDTDSTLNDPQKKKRNKKPPIAGTRGLLSIDSNDPIRTSKGELVRLSDLEKSTPVYCPYHNDSKPSAFTTRSKTGVRGVRCSSCQQTFWETNKETPPYDFYEFDRLAHGAHNMGITDTYVEEPGVEYDVPNLNLVFSDQYLRVETIGIMNGITLIKSPKGSGKTKYLKNVVTHFKKKKQKVLLVGHRQSLLRALSSSLGLTCYMDDKGPNVSGVYDINKYYAVSIDSLSTRLVPARHSFDVVLVDESEQVFSHLIANTLEADKQRKSFLIFQHYIRAAKTVIALDADMNAVSLYSIQRFGSKNPLIDRRYILNEYKPLSSEIEIYARENHLVGDMIDSLKKGHRLFIACNSKKRVEELAATITTEFGDGFPIKCITSANSNSKETTAFIENITTDILNYRALLVSPAMGTGIDITFPDDLSHVDGVYGFFYAKVNTHNDIDQQISRVRQPNYTKVWITPQTFDFEYEVDPIKQELAESGIVPGAMKGYDAYSGAPQYDFTEPFLELYATILSAQRASKNSLKKNFIDLRKHNGWKVVDAVNDDPTATAGGVLSKLGKAAALDQYITGILTAPKASWDEASKLGERRKRGRISREEENAVERYWIEYFYGEDATEEMLRQDNRGEYRNKVMRLEGVIRARPYTGKAGDGIALLSKLIEEAGLLDANGKLEFDKVVTKESLKLFTAYCGRAQVKIQRVFEMELRKDIKIDPTRQLNAFLDLCGLKVVRYKTISKGNTKIYEYGLDRVSYDKAMSLIEKRTKPTASPEVEMERRGSYEATDPLDNH